MKLYLKPKYKEVLKFIKDFKRFESSEVLKRTFTQGYCYWFAHILHARFPKSEIVYYSAGIHFACKIYNKVFDITGDITHKNLFFESWEEYQKVEPVESEKVIKYCITKTGI